MYEQPAPPPPNAEKIIKTLLLEEDEESERAVRPSIHTMRCDAALYGIPEKLFIIPLESRASGGGPSSRRLAGEGEGGRGMQQQHQTTQCAFVFVTYDIRHAHVEAREFRRGKHQNLRVSNLEESS